MYFLGELLFAIGMALFFTLVFTLAFKRPGPWHAWWAFFLVVLLAAWAGGLWLTPVGPVFVGVSWLPIIIVALLVGLLLASVSPPPRETPVEKPESKAEKAVDLFFWGLLLALALVIVLGYCSPALRRVVTEL